MKPYLFNQPAGLGDIFFIMSLAQKYKMEGHPIVWPTAVHFHVHNKNFPEVKFIPQEQFGFLYGIYDEKREIYEDNSYKVFPFRWADVIIRGKSDPHTCMKDKYSLVGEDYKQWRNFKITRDHVMENKLFKSLGLKESDEYNLINENQTREFMKTEIKPDNGLRNIYMNRDDPQYNMLDWMKVMYNATTIHTVATSTLILIESLSDLLPKEAHIYKRIWDTDHSWYDYYMEKEYIWH